MLEGFGMLIDMIKTIVFYLFLLIASFFIGYHIGSFKKPIVTTYSSSQIDNLIKVNAILGSQVKQQLDYEQSFSQKQ
jgi:hypothetical protein